MLGFLLRKLRFWQLSLSQRDGSKGKPRGQTLSASLAANVAAIKDCLGSSPDVIIRQFLVGSDKGTKAVIVFIDGLADKALINESILRPLMVYTRVTESDSLAPSDIVDFVATSMVTVGEVKRTRVVNDIVDAALSGETGLVIDGSREALIISSRGWETRGVEEPKTEVVIRGPREGFTETLRVNTALLRRKIRSRDLTFEIMKLGERTRTDVCIAYLKGVASDRLIEEIRRRLEGIVTDAILESGYIEEYIEDAPFSPFATVANSERPDTVAAKMLEGRAAILVDGTPIVLTVPMVFMESFQSPEDYYSRPYYSTLVRWLRFLAFAFSTLSPAIYVAFTTFHQELIPTPLLITMAAAREGVPFPAVIEAYVMGIVFEILREAGVRMPRPIGQAVSIVGALVIGESAVTAGLAGAPMVIVVAITAIASFAVPAQADVGAIMRLILTFLAGTMGAFGLGIGLLGFLIHLASLRSFGTPYLSPLAPLTTQDMKDVAVRAPLWTMITRPRTIGWHDPHRQEFSLVPEPPSDEENESVHKGRVK